MRTIILLTMDGSYTGKYESGYLDIYFRRKNKTYSELTWSGTVPAGDSGDGIKLIVDHLPLRCLPPLLDHKSCREHVLNRLSRGHTLHPTSPGEKDLPHGYLLLKACLG